MSQTSPEKSEEMSPIERAIGGLALRNIGPALMGGRIADVAVDPRRSSTWYVAVGSGGVWKTTNAGTTWTPIFDDQPSFSIGCVTLDPSRPDVVWVGTGEAVSGRHVAWGSGVYRSRNGGTTWEHMGLPGSEHIGRILVDPRDGDVVYVAAEGPLWSSGGERGVFKTTDGGATWDAVLEIDEDTGVTSLEFAPDDPDTIYAATYQRRRRVWSFVGGGPGSGIHRSSDAGATWRRVTDGLPEGDMGKIGLAVTPADPDLVYATVEADKETRGFYRSRDRGESWERRNEYISGGTGPHYYQEIFASPSNPDIVYQVDVFLHVTRDAGKTFTNIETGKNKHSDNHVVWIDPGDDDHLLVGTDAGLYESFDSGTSYRHVSNLPVSQFYRVAADNSLPFYDVLGGAQDLGTLLGPSRTGHVDGVRNQDWSVPLGADGYHVVFDPDDPSTCYLEWQEGNVMRLDRSTMELQDIKPQPAPGDPPERWNWDCPIVLSPHDSRTVYVGSQRVWKSTDRGESWTAISGDLTRDQNRYELAAFDHVSSVDALYDNMAMSMYDTITMISESPVEAGVLYVGTDDGLVQVSEDGGASWRTAESLPGVPDDAFVNDVEASLHDPDAVFVAADAHKNGDTTPFLHESHDRGRTWTSIRGDLPDGALVWAIEQDHLNPDLIFLGTEAGLFVTVNHGENWHRLSKDVPTISFRDIALQRRDDDLVGGSFGRGFFVLDDYSPLRSLSDESLAAPAHLFPVRRAWWYTEHEPMQAAGQPTLGSTAYRAPNPPFGATFTYHLAETHRSLSAARRETEKELPEGADRPTPSWEALTDEHLDQGPSVFAVVRDADGAVVTRVTGTAEQGLHRISWDLRSTPPDPIELDPPAFKAPWESDPQGALVAPGTYSVEMELRRSDGTSEVLAGPEHFDVVAVPGLDEAATAAETQTFRTEVSELRRAMAGDARLVRDCRERVRHLRAAAAAAPAADDVLTTRIDAAHRSLEDLAARLVGDPVKERFSEPATPSIKGLVDRVVNLGWSTTKAPTATQRTAVERAAAEHADFRSSFDELLSELAELAASVDEAGGPWTPR